MKSTFWKFGLFTAISLALLLVLYNTMSNQVSGGTHDMKAEFTNVSGLRPGDDVRAAGVSVGRVQSVAVGPDGLASVDFILKDDQQIYANTSMVVRYQNLLGQRYLALVPGSGASAQLPAGSTVPASRTSPGFDLTALLNGFEPLFATLEPAQINTLSASIVSVLQGEGGTIEGLLNETATVSTRLSDNDQVFGRIIDNLTPVLQNMAAHSSDFDSTVTQLDALMSGLAKERMTIGDSLDGLSNLSAATSELVTKARPDLARDLRTLAGLSDTVVKNSKTVADVLDNLPLATDAFSRPMSHGSWLNIYICNIAIDASGSRINLGGASGPYSQVCR